MPIPRTAALAALAVALALPAARAAEVDPYAPADSEWVLQLNLKRLADAPAVKKHAAGQVTAGLTGGIEALRPLAALGLDPLKDLDTATAAGSGLLQFERVLLVARGKLDAAKLRKAAAAKAEGESAAWKAHKEGGVTVYEARAKGRPAAYLVVLDDGTLLVSGGRKVVVTAAAVDPKKPAKVSKGLRALVAKADAKDAVWLAALPPERLRKALADSPATAGIAKDVGAFSASLKVGAGVKVALNVHTAGKESAAAMAELLDAAKGFAAAAAFNVDGVGPLLADLFNDCKATTKDETATLSGELSEDQIAKALKKP